MWYQHRVPPRAPDYVRVIPVEGNRRIGVDGVDALLWLVNQAAITFHGFASREGSLEHPDWLLLDLDPPDDGAWPRVVKVALALRKMLELLEVESVLKTSGQKGLHVVVPLASGQRAAEVKLAARRISELLHALLPQDTTLETEREKRQGRVFLDANQGYVGKTLVLPYSARGVDGAPVSTPLRWDELSATVPPGSFTIRTLRARLDRVGDLAAGLGSGSVQVARLLERLPAPARTSTSG
jgi:bifunctional non-homologous end joining protein LigD